MWRYALLELFALGYFYLQWSAHDAQHRQFHFLLMCSYLITTAFYGYQIAVRSMMVEAFAMTGWWFQLISNVLFEAELLLIIGYALLFRKARAGRRKYYDDVDSWFAKAGAVKRGMSGFLGGRKR